MVHSISNPTSPAQLMSYPYMPESKSFEHPRSPPPRPISWMAPRLRRIHEVNEHDDYSRRLAWMSNSARNHVVAAIGELVGTFMFLFFGFGLAQVANSKPQVLAVGTQAPDLQQLLYISAGFSISLAVNAWVFYRVSGSAFNPAVILGLCLIGAVPWTRGIVVVPFQLLGASLAALVIGIILPGDITFGSSLGGDTSVVQGLLIEMLATAELLFTIMMLAVEKHRATFIAPVAIGMALFIGHMLAISFTGSSLNPARSFGPAIVTGVFPAYHWIYWLGPALGAILAATLYQILKYLEYETNNGGQDDDGRPTYQVVQNKQSAKDIWHEGATLKRRDSVISTSSIHSCVWCEDPVLALGGKEIV